MSGYIRSEYKRVPFLNRDHGLLHRGVRSIIVAISTTSDHRAHCREMNPEAFRDLLKLMRSAFAFCLISPHVVCLTSARITE